ncbi:MAG: hypothetical protein OQK24_05030 [Magnetovibrio sp.]|nr:hypothetical protein [Magnetovibrio sp.]
MPLDVRKLIFSRQELRLAFQKYAKDNNMNVPASHVEDIEIIDDKFNSAVSDTTSAGISVTLRYTSSDPHNPIRVRINQQQAQEALVVLCRSLKIPIPKRGQKFLQMHKNSLAMTIGMSQDDIRDSSVSQSDQGEMPLQTDAVEEEQSKESPPPKSPEDNRKLVRPDHAAP